MRLDHPDTTALVFFGRGTSYAGLFEEAKRVAAGLAGLGMAGGDRVAVMLRIPSKTRGVPV